MDDDDGWARFLSFLSLWYDDMDDGGSRSRDIDDDEDDDDRHPLLLLILLPRLSDEDEAGVDR